jgi:hypothetical protein
VRDLAGDTKPTKAFVSCGEFEAKQYEIIRNTASTWRSFEHRPNIDLYGTVVEAAPHSTAALEVMWRGLRVVLDGQHQAALRGRYQSEPDWPEGWTQPGMD